MMHRNGCVGKPHTNQPTLKAHDVHAGVLQEPAHAALLVLDEALKGGEGGHVPADDLHLCVFSGVSVAAGGDDDGLARRTRRVESQGHGKQEERRRRRQRGHLCVVGKWVMGGWAGWCG